MKLLLLVLAMALCGGCAVQSWHYYVFPKMGWYWSESKRADRAYENLTEAQRWFYMTNHLEDDVPIEYRPKSPKASSESRGHFGAEK